MFDYATLSLAIIPDLFTLLKAI